MGVKVKRGLPKVFSDHIKTYGLIYIALLGIFIVGLLFGFSAPASMDASESAEVRGAVVNFLNHLPSANINGGAEFWRSLQLNAIF